MLYLKFMNSFIVFCIFEVFYYMGTELTHISSLVFSKL